MLRIIISFVIGYTCFSSGVVAQADIIANPDSFCFTPGDNQVFNVMTNDVFPSSGFTVFTQQSGDWPSCFRMNDKGEVSLVMPFKDCCGKYTLRYKLNAKNQQNEMLMAQGEIQIEVKCPKPNCTVISLETSPGSDSGANGSQKQTYYACEDTPITYFVPYIAGNGYTWVAGPGATVSPGINPAEVQVVWAGSGPNTLTLTTTTGLGATTQVFCMQILPAPVASFTKSSTVVCLGSPISFTNNSSGASSYYWDFGDGNSSSLPSPTHSYSTSGTFTVTLYAYSSNYDPKGNPLCCCTDSMQMQVMVDDKPGPDIQWISTLCEGDTSKYWTTAQGCQYTWSVTTANGSPIPFTGQGNDTICVVWPSGPFGVITLDLSNCSPAIYCELPVTVHVPIISSVEQVDGDEVVCAGAKEPYSLPKWPGVIYEWTVTGGMVVSGDSTDEVTIMWGSGPVGTIHVDYYSPFLQGLPGHEGEECTGVADLTVQIRPEYGFLPTPASVCKGSTTSISTNLTAPLGFTWTASPALPGFPVVGTNTVTITWPSTGYYTICAVPNNAGYFCNDTVCTTIFVTEMPIPDSITGPKSVCPGGTYTYFANSSQNNVSFTWSVTNGILSSPTGNPVMVTWNNNTLPGTISLTQSSLSDPYCTSASISCPITKKKLNTPLTLSPGPACTNATQTYNCSPVQDPSAVYQWVVTPTGAGSVVSGQGGPSAMVQWNNVAGPVSIKCIVSICNEKDSVSLAMALTAPISPVITLTGNLCPGGTAFLNLTNGPFSPISWSTGGNTATIPINTAGAYVVTTTDGNGCSAVTTYTANNVNGPNASISSADILSYCVSPSIAQPFVTLTALTNPNYQYQWYCNGSPVGTWTTTPTLTHTSTSTPGTFVYYAQVMDMSTGCKKNSNILVVYQLSCPSGPGNGCTPQSHNVTIAATNSTPYCNTGLFNVTATNATPMSWQFGDPLSNVNTGTAANAVHAYSSAGYYVAVLTYVTPNANGPGNCQLLQPVSICIPVVADFDIDRITCRTYQFTNMSTYIPGLSISTAFWDFGDGNTSTALNPTHTYLTCGTYNVMLTVTTNTGCLATITYSLTAPCDPVSLYSMLPNPACVGEPVKFTPVSSPGIISYLWNFGDGSFGNAAVCPSHSFLSSGTFNTSLVVSDNNGCKDSTSLPLQVYPVFVPDTIAYSPSLTVCNGNSVTLTGPPATGYLWSTGATTNTIQVNQSGWYGVTVTDANGCTAVPDSVEVIILPPVQAILSGGQVICDNGCITIAAAQGAGYSYQWFDAQGQAIPFQTSPSLQVCQNTFQDSVYLIVTEMPSLCADTSAWWPITLASSPQAAITVVSGNLCAGSPSLLMASATPPANIVYVWSTGATTTSILAIQEGTYTVYATDTLTGCKDAAFVTVNPLPDLCMVPTGCYTSCNPDTLCGPFGYPSYQWNFNGSPIPNETGPCLEVSQSGSYSLTVINAFNCAATSDTLILEMVPCCDEDDTKVKAIPLSLPGECCFALSYYNTQDSLMSMVITATGGNIQLLPGSVIPPLTVGGITANSITLVHTTPNTPLPVGNLNSFIKICTDQVVSTPVVLDISWNWPDNPMLCHDTVHLSCPVSHECVYISEDTIYCKDNGSWLYQFTVCNPSGNTFSFGYLDLVAVAPAGVNLFPGDYTPAFPIAPGTCQTFATTLTGPGLVNQSFCFNLVVHEQNPTEFPGSACCSLDSTLCIPIPGCGPCDSVYVKNVIPNEEDSCCYALTLVNYHDPSTYTGVQICGLDPSVALTVANTPGSGWNLVNYTSGNFILEYDAGFIPLSTFTLPEICIADGNQALQSLEIKWLGNSVNGESVLCRDTIEVVCPDACGYHRLVKAGCTDNGGFILSMTYYNTSPDTIYSLNISFDGPGLSGYNQAIALPGVLPGASFGPFQVTVGPPAQSGDTLCFYTTMHNHPDGGGDACCRFYTCVTLPECSQGPKECACDEKFEQEVLQGFSISISGFTGVFQPLGNLTSCDKVIWDWIDEGTSSTSVGKASVTHVFPGFGEYRVCMTVIRTTPSGKQCKVKVTKEIAIVPEFFLYLTPNPARDLLQVRIKAPDDIATEKKIQISDMKGSLVYEGIAQINERGVAVIPVEDLLNGIYFVKVFDAYHQEIRKFIKIE